MTKTIQAALAPILIIGSLYNLCYLEYPFGRPRPYLTYLYFLVKWSVFTYLFYYLIYTNHIAASFFFNLLCKVRMPITTLSMIINLFRFKELKLYLHKLSIVDDTLEMIGIPKEYQRLHNWTIKLIIAWSIIVCIADISNTIVLNYDDFSFTTVFAPYFGNHLNNISNFNSIIWGLIMGYISSRFQRINEHLYNLLEDSAKHIERKNLISNCQKRTETKEHIQHMWTLTHVHLQLCSISRALNDIFSIQMTLHMAFTFICFVKEFCTIYTSYIIVEKISGYVVRDVFAHIWATMRLMVFLTLNHICQTVYDKVNETTTILYKLHNDSSDEDLREQILQFILQIKQREIRFSGMGLFHFGYTFSRQFYTSIATVIVIIMEMNIIYDKV